MYPAAASFGVEGLDVSGTLATSSPSISLPDDENVRIGMFFSHNLENAYAALGIDFPTPSISDVGNRMNGTFDFTVTRYIFTGVFVATADTVTITGKTGYLAGLQVDNAIVYIASTSTGASDYDSANFLEGGSDLFDFSSIGGDITDSSILNNFYVVQVTYNPPSGFTGTVSAAATDPLIMTPGPS